MIPVPSYHYQILSATLFCLGLYTVMTRKNAVSILMGVELILNAANVNFVGFARGNPAPVGAGSPPWVSGHVFVIFVILLAACEAAVALAIIIGVYKNFDSIDVDDTKTLQG